MGAVVEAIPLILSILSGIIAAVLGRRSRADKRPGAAFESTLDDVEEKIGDTKKEAKVAAGEVQAISRQSDLIEPQAGDIARLSERVDGIMKTVASLPEELERIKTENKKSARDAQSLGIALFVFGAAITLTITLFVHPIS